MCNATDTVHIKSLVKLLPNMSLVTLSSAEAILCLSLSILARRVGILPSPFTYSHKKKSHRDRSGDRGGFFIKKLSSSPPPPRSISRADCYWDKHILFPSRGCPRGVMVKAMDCRIVVSEFVLQSRYYVHFRSNTLGKGIEPPYPPSYGLNCPNTVLLGEWH